MGIVNNNSKIWYLCCGQYGVPSTIVDMCGAKEEQKILKKVFKSLGVSLLFI